MATLKDVAKKVGVSVATVSYVLNGRGSVSEAVSEKVLKAVEELDYRPNRRAQAMRTGTSKLLGMILPDLTKPYFPELAQKVESAARSAGFSVVLVDCQDQLETEQQGFDLLRQQGVDGVIWFPIADRIPRGLDKLGCPMVLIDQPMPGFDTVHCDFVQGGKMQAEYALRTGHRKVALLTGPLSVDSACQRRRGFVDAAKGKLEIVWERQVPFSTRLSDEVCELLADPQVSLVVCADDLIAIGVMDALKSHGVPVPQQVSVIGFDNIPWGRLVSPALTTINQPIADIGAQAVQLLIDKINLSDRPAGETVLPVSLVERQSVRSLI